MGCSSLRCHAGVFFLYFRLAFVVSQFYLWCVECSLAVWQLGSLTVLAVWPCVATLAVLGSLAVRQCGSCGSVGQLGSLTVLAACRFSVNMIITDGMRSLYADIILLLQ